MAGNKFMFATGIENSYPTIQLPDGSTKRIDEMEKGFHYQNWKKDFELVKDIGIEFLRYGPPYYNTHSAPGCYNWGFTDQTFNALKEIFNLKTNINDQGYEMMAVPPTQNKTSFLSGLITSHKNQQTIKLMMN